MPRSKKDGGVAVLNRTNLAIPLAVGGLPSPESIFTVHCVLEIVRRTQGQSKAVPLNTGQDAERLSEASCGDPVIPFFDTPDGDAHEALLATEAPIVIVTGDFGDTARFCMVARDLDQWQAARFVSQSFSCLEPLRGQDRVRWIRVDTSEPIEDWIDRVAGWLDLQPSAWQSARREMLADYGEWATVQAAIHGLVQFSDPSSPAWDHMPAETQPLFALFRTSYHGGSIDTVFWPADSLLEITDVAHPVSGAIRLTGPARLLTYGPYLHLPPGRWTARYQFEADEHPAGNLVEFDILNGANILVSRRVMVESAGRFGLDCTFDVVEPRLPIENRAILVEGAIGGWFKPVGVWLSREE